jgi:hypothetical protein
MDLKVYQGIFTQPLGVVAVSISTTACEPSVDRPNPH